MIQVRDGPTGRGDHSPCEREETARALAGSAPPPGVPAPNSGTLWTPEDLALVVSGGLKSFILCSFSLEGFCSVAQQRSVWRIFSNQPKSPAETLVSARERSVRARALGCGGFRICTGIGPNQDLTRCLRLQLTLHTALQTLSGVHPRMWL